MGDINASNCKDIALKMSSDMNDSLSLDELVALGVSLRNRISTTISLSDVIGDPSKFFTNVHNILKKLFVIADYDSFSNCEVFVILLTIVDNCIRFANSSIWLFQIVPDVVHLLQYSFSWDKAKDCCIHFIHSSSEMSLAIRLEINRAVENCNVELVAAFLKVIDDERCPKNLLTSLLDTCIDGDSQNDSANFEISFLPSSMIEQWLLAIDPHEIAFVLEEVGAMYSSLTRQLRQEAHRDVPVVAKRVLLNLKQAASVSRRSGSGRDHVGGAQVAVAVNGLRLLECLAEDHLDAFAGILAILFPFLKEYMTDSRPELRHHALRLSGWLSARLTFATMHNIHLFNLEELADSQRHIKDVSSTLISICVSLLNNTLVIDSLTDFPPTGATVPLRSTWALPAAPHAPRSVAESSALAVVEILGYMMTVLSRDQQEDAAKHNDSSISAALDVCAACLLVLTPETDLQATYIQVLARTHVVSSSFGATESLLPHVLIAVYANNVPHVEKKHLQKYAGCLNLLHVEYQKEIVKRAFDLVFPSLSENDAICPLVTVLLKSRQRQKEINAIKRRNTERLSQIASVNSLSGLAGSPDSASAPASAMKPAAATPSPNTRIRSSSDGMYLDLQYMAPKTMLSPRLSDSDVSVSQQSQPQQQQQLFYAATPPSRPPMGNSASLVSPRTLTFQNMANSKKQQVGLEDPSVNVIAKKITTTVAPPDISNANLIGAPKTFQSFAQPIVKQSVNDVEVNGSSTTVASIRASSQALPILKPKLSDQANQPTSYGKLLNPKIGHSEILSATVQTELTAMRATEDVISAVPAIQTQVPELSFVSPTSKQSSFKTKKSNLVQSSQPPLVNFTTLATNTPVLINPNESTRIVTSPSLSYLISPSSTNHCDSPDMSSAVVGRSLASAWTSTSALFDDDDQQLHASATGCLRTDSSEELVTDTKSGECSAEVAVGSGPLGRQQFNIEIDHSKLQFLKRPRNNKSRRARTTGETGPSSIESNSSNTGADSTGQESSSGFVGRPLREVNTCDGVRTLIAPASSNCLLSMNNNSGVSGLSIKVMSLDFNSDMKMPSLGSQTPVAIGNYTEEGFRLHTLAVVDSGSSSISVTNKPAAVRRSQPVASRAAAVGPRRRQLFPRCDDNEYQPDSNNAINSSSFNPINSNISVISDTVSEKVPALHKPTTMPNMEAQAYPISNLIQERKGTYSNSSSIKKSTSWADQLDEVAVKVSVQHSPREYNSSGNTLVNAIKAKKNQLMINTEESDELDDTYGSYPVDQVGVAVMPPIRHQSEFSPKYSNANSFGGFSSGKTAKYNNKLSTSEQSIGKVVEISLETSERDKVMSSLSSFKTETCDYLTAADIKPSLTPAKDFAKALAGLGTQEWPEIFHTLNTVRCIALHHQDLLTAPGGNFHALVLGVMKQIDNLRSAVAKNAILALGDMFQGLGRHMDGEVAGLLPSLIKRFGDTSSSFLGESAETALMQMIMNVSAPRSLAGFMIGLDNRSPLVRGQVASLLLQLVIHRGGDLKGSKEIDVLLPKLNKMLTDHTPEARSSSREIIKVLLKSRVIDRDDLDQVMSNDVITKLLAQDSEQGVGAGLRQSVQQSSSTKGTSWTPQRSRSNQRGGAAAGGGGVQSGLSVNGQSSGAGDNNINITGSSSKARQKATGDSEKSSNGGDTAGATKLPSTKASASGGSGSSRSRATANRLMENIEELQSLPTTFQQLASSKWTERLTALTSLTDTILRHTIVLQEAGKISGCVDRILEHLDDGSIKIVLHSIGCVDRLMKEAAAVLLAMPLIIVPALLSTASSSNRQVSTLASASVKELLSMFGVTEVVQQLGSAAMHDKDRVRALAFRLLTEQCSCVCSDPATEGSSLHLFKKYIFPPICLTISAASTKADIKVAAQETLRTIHHAVMSSRSSSCDNDKLWQWTEDPKLQDEIKRILST